MANTTAQNVYDSFESSFMDKHEIPENLELMWLNKAVAEYSTEIEPLNFIEELMEFDAKLSQYVVDVLGQMIKVFYVERQVSRVNKIASVVGNDLSINGQNGLQKYTSVELSQCKKDLADMVQKLKPSAYN